jgi:hypothetical protein
MSAADMTVTASLPQTTVGPVTVKTTPSWTCDFKASKTTGPWDAGLGGAGNLNAAAAPFSELMTGAKLEALLKDATTVTVAGGTISISSKLPASFLTVLNKVNEGVTTFDANYTLSYDIVVAGGKVTAINNIKGSGNCSLLGSPVPSSITAAMTFK